MYAEIHVAVVSPTLYARIEPTCDLVVQRYAPNPHQWCDLVFYRDSDATQFYARRCACIRWRLRARPSRVTLNCFNWRVKWLPSLTTMEVRDGGE